MNIKKQILSPTNFYLGKIPPQAIDIEEVVLGALMIDKTAFLKIANILKAESFYKDAHQKIFQAIYDLAQNNQPIDILTITEKLRNKKELDEVGGAYYITQLTNRVSGGANIEFHSHIIVDKWLSRELIRITQELNSMAYDESLDIHELFDYFYDEIIKIKRFQETCAGEMTYPELIKESMDKYYERKNLFQKGLPQGIKTSFPRLDKYIGGWQPGDFIILAARPSNGKTALALSFMRSAAFSGYKAKFFSLDTTKLKISNRNIISLSGINGEAFKRGNLIQDDENILNNKLDWIMSLPVYIDDRNFTIENLCLTIKESISRNECNIAFIDYVGILKTNNLKLNIRELNVLISISLKQLAKDTNIPIFALCQLNRNVELRSNKLPQLSDLRESGQYEQDADIVLFIHQPSKYDENEPKEKSVLYIAKNKEGATGTIDLWQNEDLSNFFDNEQDYFNSIQQKEVF